MNTLNRIRIVLAASASVIGLSSGAFADTAPAPGTASPPFALAPTTLRQEVPGAQDVPGHRPFALLAATPQPDATGLWNDYREGWHWRSYMTLWFAGVKGDVGTDRVTADVDASFSDLAEDLDLALSLNFELGNGPWTFAFNGMYFGFEREAETRRTGNDVDFEATFAFVDVGLYYLLLDVPVGNAGEQRFYLELGGGVRWTYLDATIDVEEGPLSDEDVDRERDFFDPYVGARARFDFSRQFNASLAGTAGGFGVGSDFAWSLRGQLEYRFTPKISVVGGYQVLDYDYDDDNFVWDVSMHGPFVGLSFRM